MAISIYSKPQERTPAYNDQWFSVLSTQIAQPDFKYIAEITINGTYVLTDTILQRPDGWCLYNAKEKVQNYIEHYFNPNDLDFNECPNKAVSVDIVFYEYYGGTSYTQPSGSYSYVAFDACLNESDFNEYDYTTFTSGLLGDNVLNTTPFFNKIDTKVGLTQDVFIHGFGDSLVSVEFEAQTGLGTVNFTLNNTGYISDNIYCLNIGYKTLVDNGVTPDEGTIVYATLVNTSGSYATIVYTMETPCTKFTPYSIYYLARNGRIMYADFNLVSEKSANRTVNSVKLSKLKLNTTSGVLTSNLWDREKHQVSSQTTYQMTLNSNWLTDQQKTDLEELVDSPMLWLFDGNDFISISSSDLSYRFNKNENMELFNLTLNIEFDTKETRQRGI